MIAMRTLVQHQKVNFSDLLFQYEFHAESGVFPGFTECDFLKVHDQYMAGNYRRDALKALEAGLKYYPKSTSFYAYKAIRLMESKKTKMALEQIEEAEFLGHCPVDATLIRCRIYSKQNKRTKALSILKALRQDETLSSDQLTEVILTQAEILQKEGAIAQAYDEIISLLYKQPKNIEALIEIQKLIDNNRWYRDGIVLHMELIHLAPDSWRAWFNLGQSYYGKMNYEKAISAFRKCISLNPNFSSAYMDCAEVCQQLLKFRQALDCYQAVAEIMPPNDQYYFQIAECHFGLDELDEAKKYYLKSIERNAKNEEVFFKMGKCYEKEYALRLAERFYKKAWQSDQTREDFVEALASCYFKMGRHSKVMPLLEKVIELNPTEDHAWVMYAKFLILTGHFDEAKILFEKAEEHTYSGKLMLCKAAVHYLTGATTEAFDALAEGLEESYESIGLFFELVPHIRHNKKVKDILHYYDPEYFY